MKKIYLSLISGFLFVISWVSIGFFPFIFFAFIPLLALEAQLSKTLRFSSGKYVFLYSFISFLIFNFFTTYWICHATIFGAIMAFLINSLLMAFAFYLFHKIKSQTNNRLGYIAFVAVWITMEYLHLNWDLSWPWLTLGNVFANFPIIVQWYEFTGFLGGSLWVLILNVYLFEIIYIKNRKNKLIKVAFFGLFFPIVFSVFLHSNYEYIKKEILNIVVVQPNVDPYKDKFVISYEKQLNDFISLSKKKITNNTSLLVGPETAILEQIWEDKDNRYNNSLSILKFRELQKQFPNLNILVGATTYRLFHENEKKSSTAREIRDKNIFYDVYNSAIFISKEGEVQIYHKTKLVPGAEKIPFPYFFNNLSFLSVNLGGVSGSLGSDNSIKKFSFSNVNLLPLICYESIYGESGLQKKINLISVITNDGWWKETAGYKQHFAYSRLRSVEQRKTIIRSANTGISGVIDERGNILKQTKWDEETVFSVNVNTNENSTFYNKYGDYIGRISSFISVLFILMLLVRKIKNPN